MNINLTIIKHKPKILLIILVQFKKRRLLRLNTKVQYHLHVIVNMEINLILNIPNLQAQLLQVGEAINTVAQVSSLSRENRKQLIKIQTHLWTQVSWNFLDFKMIKGTWSSGPINHTVIRLHKHLNLRRKGLIRPIIINHQIEL